MKRIYAVMVSPKYSASKISSEAYTSLAEAQSFIERRADEPEKVSEFVYVGRSYSYTIHELTVKE